MFYRSFSGTIVPMSRPPMWGHDPAPVRQARKAQGPLHTNCLSVYLEHPWQLVGNNYEAPAVLIREGVHHGSHGPIFWAGRILKANAQKWEGAPLVVGHPHVGGEDVGIKHPQAPAPIGKVVRPRYDEAKQGIVAVLRIPKDTPNITAIMKLKEVSVGVFTEEIEDYGHWQGEAYTACSITMEPDHLAILSGPGACSWADGCGVRVNAQSNQTNKGEQPMVTDKEKILVAQAITTLKGEMTMSSSEILLPPGVHEDETETSLQVLERAIGNLEADGIVPMELRMAAMNERRRQEQREEDQDQERQKERGAYHGRGERAAAGAGEILLPPGVK